MNSIAAPYTDKSATRGDGLCNKKCPVCHQVLLETDLFQTCQEGVPANKMFIEICPECLNNFTYDTGIKIEEDVVSREVFEALYRWCQENTEEPDPEESAIVVATAPAAYFGGYAWQSGGGIELILIERADGQLCVLSSDCACIYASHGEFFDGQEPVEALSFRG